MHFVKVKGILSAKNGMNLYRGCQHGCIYCDSRSTCYQMGHRFEDIEVKENAIELLDYALKHKRRSCMIGTGAMTDPYIPLEEELKMTRQALELIDRYGMGVAVQTKSDRILRDMDLLRSINEKSKAVVQMTLTTGDEKLCSVVEPNVSGTADRYRALKEFQSEGIPTVVWLCPILPFINDTEDNIKSIVEYCADAGVRGIINFGMGLTLREGSREYFYSRLDRLFPGIKEEYIRRYGNAYEVPSPKWRELTKVFINLCGRYGIERDNNAIFAYMQSFEDKESKRQMSLFEQ